MMNGYFECNDIGELKEYVGCKNENREFNNWISIVQPVIIKVL
jgi:hypothetical protein